MSETQHSRLPAMAGGSLFVLGSVIFLAGGSRHPRITAALAPLGTEAFFEAFTSHVRMTPNWSAMHMLILFGPMMWLFGATVMTPPDAEPGAAVHRAARAALGIGAILWAVAFVMDGFSHLQLANDIGAASAGEVRESLMRDFRLSATTMARLGLVSWTLIGVSIVALGGGLLARARRSPVAALAGAAGVLLGGAQIYGWVTGDFTPGPFTSPYWTAAAVLVAFWFGLFGALEMARGRIPRHGPS